MKAYALVLTAMLFLVGLSSVAQQGSPGTASLEKEGTSPESITILWSSGNQDVFENIIMPYFDYSCRTDCWKDMTLFLWGPSVQMLAQNPAVQDELSVMITKGLHVKACSYSAEKYQASARLKAMGVELSYIEEELTSGLKGRMARLVAF